MEVRHICCDDFITTDDEADTAKPCTYEHIVNEVCSQSDLEESNDDETSEPASAHKQFCSNWLHY